MKNTTSTKAWILCLMVFVLTIVLMSHAVHGQNITYNYSKSILTNFVDPSDYPAANVASFGSNVKLYWKLLKNEKSTNINDAILEFGAIGRRYVCFVVCFQLALSQANWLSELLLCMCGYNERGHHVWFCQYCQSTSHHC